VSFQQWLQQGETVYQNALQEHQAMQAQLEEIERRLAAKKAELNQIAAILNKPQLEPGRKAPAGPPAGTISFVIDNDGQANNNGNSGEPITRPAPSRPMRQPLAAG
jgi:hypothetical protein